MRKVMITVVGLAGLSLLLCGSGAAMAQADTAPSGVGTGGAGTWERTGTTSDASASGPATGGAGASSVDLGPSVVQLQGEVAQLRQELAQVRAELANLTANTGVGGSGQAGVEPSRTQTGTAAAQDTAQRGTGGSGAVAGGTAGQGNAPRGNTNAAQGSTARGTANRGSDAPGEAVVDAIYTGTVRSVSAGRLVLLDEAGQPFTVELSDRTRVLRNGQRISADQLKQGTRVRATVDMLSGHNQAKEVTTLPAR